MSHYDTLGVATDAGAEDIKAGYRRAARANHPDKGGNDADMARVNKAYAVLSDPGKRQAYDATGDDSDNAMDLAAQFLMNAFNAAIEHNIERDIVGKVRSVMTSDVKELRNRQDLAKQRQRRLEKLAGRVRAKTGENLYQSILDSRAKKEAREIAAIDQEISTYTAALQLLDNYESNDPKDDPAVSPRQYHIGRGAASFIDDEILRSLFGNRGF